MYKWSFAPLLICSWCDCLLVCSSFVFLFYLFACVFTCFFLPSSGFFVACSACFFASLLLRCRSLVRIPSLFCTGSTTNISRFGNSKHYRKVDFESHVRSSILGIPTTSPFFIYLFFALCMLSHPSSSTRTWLYKITGWGQWFMISISTSSSWDG